MSGTMFFLPVLIHRSLCQVFIPAIEAAVPGGSFMYSSFYNSLYGYAVLMLNCPITMSSSLSKASSVQWFVNLIIGESLVIVDAVYLRYPYNHKSCFELVCLSHGFSFHFVYQSGFDNFHIWGFGTKCQAFISWCDPSSLSMAFSHSSLSGDHVFFVTPWINCACLGLTGVFLEDAVSLLTNRVIVLNHCRGHHSPVASVVTLSVTPSREWDP